MGLYNVQLTPSLVSFVPFKRHKEEKGRLVIDKRKLDGIVDGFSVD